MLLTLFQTMVSWLLILIYLALVQHGPRVCAFLQPPIFHRLPSRLRLVSQFQSTPAIVSPFVKLKESLGKGDTQGFLRNMRILCDGYKHRDLLQREKAELKSILTESGKLDLGTDQTVKVLRNLDGILSARNKEDKFVLDSFLIKFISSSSKSFQSFPLFLTSLKKLDYRWNVFDRCTKERIVNRFDDISNDGMLKGKEYRELIAGIAGLEMNWNDLKERTRTNLLERLKNIYGELDLSGLGMVIFHLGKLSVRLSPQDFIWETVTRMAVTILSLIEKEMNLKERTRIVSYFFHLCFC
jgi:hypothetical protein